jgi:hypothetical protein
MPDSDNSDDNVPYGTPGLFDDQPSLNVQTDPGEQDVPDSDSDNIEDDVPYGPGLFDRPLLVPRVECSCESPHSRWREPSRLAEVSEYMTVDNATASS